MATALLLVSLLGAADSPLLEPANETPDELLPLTNRPNPTDLIRRIGFGLGGTILALGVLFFFLRRISRVRAPKGIGKEMEVLDMHAIASGQAIYLMKVRDRAFLIGITKERMSALGEMPWDQADSIDPTFDTFLIPPRKETVA